MVRFRDRHDRRTRIGEEIKHLTERTHNTNYIQQHIEPCGAYDGLGIFPVHLDVIMEAAAMSVDDQRRRAPAYCAD